MSTPNTQITTEKLLETIGIQTVELNILRANSAQLVAENQKMLEKLQSQETAVEAEKA